MHDRFGGEWQRERIVYLFENKHIDSKRRALNVLV